MSTPLDTIKRFFPIDKIQGFFVNYWMYLAGTALIMIAAILFLMWTDIPSIRKHRQDLTALITMEQLFMAQKEFSAEANPASYAESLEELQQKKTDRGFTLLPKDFLNGKIKGYTFSLHPGGEQEFRDETVHVAWSAAAWPLKYGETGFRSYYVDESGVIRGKDIGGGPGDVTLPRIR